MSCVLTVASVTSSSEPPVPLFSSKTDELIVFPGSSLEVSNVLVLALSSLFGGMGLYSGSALLSDLMVVFSASPKQTATFVSPDSFVKLPPLSEWQDFSVDLVWPAGSRFAASSQVFSSASSLNGLGGGTLGLYQGPCRLEIDLHRGVATGGGAGGSCVQGPGWMMPNHGWLVFTLGLPLARLVLKGGRKIMLIESLFHIVPIIIIINIMVNQTILQRIEFEFDV